jgi:aryl-alcohol dehydrogenase-like predicted oxidoreductase
MHQPPRHSLTRRHVVKAGLAAGLGAALAPALGVAAAPQLPLILKTIPSTGEKIPPVGLGTNAYGVTAADELAQLRDVLKTLPELGGSLVDTARGYGSSEEVIGQLVAEIGNREKLFIATKTPLPPNDVSGGQAVLDESFRRLRVSRIDLLQVHNFHGLDALMPHFREYKQAKKIRYIGVTTSVDQQYPEMIAAMEKQPLDFIQVDYSIDNRGSADRILPMAQDKGIAVICNVPFGGRRGSVFGKLGGKPLPDFAKEFDATTWAQFLLKYILSHPAVTATIPGTTTLAHLQDNQMGARGRLPDGALRKRMEQYWDGL